MPTDVKNLQPTQDASVADVQPTKQATSIDSEKETTIIRPSKGALSNETTYVWSRLRDTQLRRAKFTNEPQAYSVIIKGTKHSRSGYGRDNHQVETIYYSYHPYMALGEAFLDFMGNGISGIIEEYAIYHQTIKKPKK